MFYEFLFVLVIVKVRLLHLRKQHFINHYKLWLMSLTHWMCMRNSCWRLLVDGWPCVPALLSLDNIVLGGWQTEGTRRHEIILCRAMCYLDRGRKGVNLLWSPPPVLPVLNDMYAHFVPSYTAFLRDLSHPSCTTVLSNTSQFFLSFLFNFFRSLFIWPIPRTRVLITNEQQSFSY